MRYVRILLLHFQYAFELRSRSFVWFLLALLNPLLFLMFWRGALGSSGSIGEWSLSSVSSYYFLVVIAGALLIAHIEEDVAFLDIQEGGLSKFLIKPFSYILFKLLDEIPWRFIQGTFGVIVFIIFAVLSPRLLEINTHPFDLVVSLFIIVLAFFVSFLFKMIVGLSALWFTDLTGLMNFIEVITLVFAGFILPVGLYPQFLQKVVLATPFPYMIYYPIVAFQGKLHSLELAKVGAIQVAWIAVFGLLYRILWREGIKKYTGVGQ